jgi:hypothetical protein
MIVSKLDREQAQAEGVSSADFGLKRRTKGAYAIYALKSQASVNCYSVSMPGVRYFSMPWVAIACDGTSGGTTHRLLKTSACSLILPSKRLMHGDLAADPLGVSGYGENNRQR